MENNELIENVQIDNFKLSYNELSEKLCNNSITLYQAVSLLFSSVIGLLKSLVKNWCEQIYEKQCSINVCPKCGNRLYTNRTTNPPFIFSFGTFIIPHRKVRCSKCKYKESLLRRWIPLGIENRITPSVGKMLIWLSTQMPYKEVQYYMNMFWGVNVSVKGIQNYVKRMSDKLSDFTNILSNNVELSISAWDKVYVFVDGVMAFIDNRWQEVKVGIIECHKGAKKYTYYFSQKTDWKSFMGNMKAICDKLGCEKAKVKHFISDAGKGITSNINLFKGYRYLIDYFHATEHINTWLSYMNLEKDELRRLYKKLTSLLYKGKVEELVDIMRKMSCSKSKMNILTREETYFVNFAKNMTYALNRQHKWLIGSGKIESACRWLIQQRFKLSGMRWKEEGFNVVLTLRLAYYNNLLFNAFKAMTTGANM